MEITKKAHQKSRKNEKIDDVGYYGPVKIPVGPKGTKSVILNKSTGFAAASNGSGVWSYQFAADDVVNCGSWADVQATWREFRILAMEVVLTPIAASSSIPIGVVLFGEHTANPTTPTTVIQALGFDNAIVTSSNILKKTKFQIRAASVEEMNFQDITANLNSMTITGYSSVGTNSVNYFFVQENFLIELRNPK